MILLSHSFEDTLVVPWVVLIYDIRRLSFPTALPSGMEEKVPAIV